MFESATLKLTVWYLIILMGVGLLFSVIIYQLATAEVSSQLELIRQRLQIEAETLQIALPEYNFAELQELQMQQAKASLFTNLLYMNLFLLALGGIVSYLMARRTLEPIEQTHEAQSRFTSDASHELRTPLAAMKTELEVALRDKSLSKKEMRELLTSNLEEVDKLAKISQTLLLLSRLDHGALPTGRVAIDDIARRLVENHNRAKSRITYLPPDKPLYVNAHKVSIEELMTILVDNALKYSPPSSKVRVTLARRGKKARLEVTNAGKGIPPEDLPHIFDRFYRVDESRSSSEKSGFGLGLSLAKKIVEMHGGDLSVSSEPDKKTTFSVSLPLYEAPSKRKRKQSK